MKLLVNDDGMFGCVEVPDRKIYKVRELKNCTIPPLFVIYEHELFQFYTGLNLHRNVNDNYWCYVSYHYKDPGAIKKSSDSSNGYCLLYYYPLTDTWSLDALDETTIERSRRNHSSLSDSSSSSSGGGLL